MTLSLPVDDAWNFRPNGVGGATGKAEIDAGPVFLVCTGGIQLPENAAIENPMRSRAASVTNFDKIRFKKRSLINAILLIPILIGVFAFSMWILGRYTVGDQEFYRAYYNSIADTSLINAVRMLPMHVGSTEPIFAVIMWSGAALNIPKDIYVSMLNTILVAGLIALLRNYRVPALMMLLVLTNYYLIVLFTGAERLKVSYIILVFSALSSGGIKWFLLAAAPLTHYQTALNYAAIAAPKVARAFLTFDPNKPVRVTWLFIGCLGILGTAAGITFSAPTIVSKLTHFVGRNDMGAFGALNALALALLGLLIARRKIRLIAMMLPILVAVVILGPDRTNMIALIIFFYAIMTDGRAGHPLAYIPMVYFSYKSIGFVDTILRHGHGFG